MKKRKAWPWFVILAVVANVVLAAGPGAEDAYACSCITTPLEDEIKASDAVFSGEVMSIDEQATPGGIHKSEASGGFPGATGRISFAVLNSWKGITAETIEVYGQGDGVNCYNTFEEGETYVVYASRGEATEGNPAPLENNACGSTKPLAYAEKDLRVLGPPASALPESGGPVAWGSGTLYATLLVVIVGSGAIIARVTRRA